MKVLAAFGIQLTIAPRGGGKGNHLRFLGCAALRSEWQWGRRGFAERWTLSPPRATAYWFLGPESGAPSRMT